MRSSQDAEILAGIGKKQWPYLHQVTQTCNNVLVPCQSFAEFQASTSSSLGHVINFSLMWK